MDQIKQLVITDLRASRKALAEMSGSRLSGANIAIWFQEQMAVFERAESVSGQLIRRNINHFMQGFWNETRPAILEECKTRIIELLDNAMMNIDNTQTIQPLEESYVARIQDSKLAKLIQEFNATRVSQPNLAGIGFRTILALIVRERAKKIEPTSKLATNPDLGNLEDVLKQAIASSTLFDDAHKRHLKRFLNGSLKDAFDSVAHKPDYLIDKGDLESAVEIMNKLLTTII